MPCTLHDGWMSCCCTGQRQVAEFAIDYLDSLSTVPLVERHPQLRQPLYSSLLQVSRWHLTPQLACARLSPFPLCFMCESLSAFACTKSSCLLLRSKLRSSEKDEEKSRSVSSPYQAKSLDSSLLIACGHVTLLLSTSLFLPLLPCSYIDSCVAWPLRELLLVRASPCSVWIGAGAVCPHAVSPGLHHLGRLGGRR